MKQVDPRRTPAQAHLMKGDRATPDVLLRWKPSLDNTAMGRTLNAG